MIATLSFEPPQGRVRRARFVPRPSLPVDAACVVANGVREGLRTLLGEACVVTIGEPVALDGAGWRSLSQGALLFATPGRATDVVFVLAARDARRLVGAAFGEETVPEDGSWSALEAGAVERIIARCANACEALCVERRGPTAMVEPTQIPPSVAYFDVRVAAPVALTLGVAIMRELPETPSQITVSPATIGSIALEVRVLLGRGLMTVPRLLELRAGSMVPLGTKVDGAGELNVAGQRIGLGTCGLRDSRAAFEVQSITMRGDPW